MRDGDEMHVCVELKIPIMLEGAQSSTKSVNTEGPTPS